MQGQDLARQHPAAHRVVDGGPVQHQHQEDVEGQEEPVVERGGVAARAALGARVVVDAPAARAAAAVAQVGGVERGAAAVVPRAGPPAAPGGHRAGGVRVRGGGGGRPGQQEGGAPEQRQGHARRQGGAPRAGRGHLQARLPKIDSRRLTSQNPEVKGFVFAFSVCLSLSAFSFVFSSLLTFFSVHSGEEKIRMTEKINLYH